MAETKRDMFLFACAAANAILHGRLAPLSDLTTTFRELTHHLRFCWTVDQPMFQLAAGQAWPVVDSSQQAIQFRSDKKALVDAAGIGGRSLSVTTGARLELKHRSATCGVKHQPTEPASGPQHIPKLRRGKLHHSLQLRVAPSQWLRYWRGSDSNWNIFAAWRNVEHR